MIIGSLEITHKRKELPCTKCREVIQKGTLAFTVRWFDSSTGKVKWFKNLHILCLADWAVYRYGVHQELHKDGHRQGRPIGGPLLALDEDTRRQRTRLIDRRNYALKKLLQTPFEDDDERRRLSLQAKELRDQIEAILPFQVGKRGRRSEANFDLLVRKALL